MTPDKNALNKIKSMSDSRLKELIDEISDSLGADRKKTAALTGDLSKLRAKLERLSPSDLEKILSVVDKSKAEEILRKINETKGR